MVDSEVDKSSEWRDLENFNLVSTVKANPVAGTGWGHPMVEAVKLPSVVEEYELEPYLPHNSLLGLWAYTGVVGFTLIWMFMAVALYFAARAYRMATQPFDRTAALSSFSMIVIYMVHLYGDMALGTWTSIYLVGLAMVVAGKTAMKVGAWRGFSRHIRQPDPLQRARRLW
jgi:O-antigen ligase